MRPRNGNAVRGNAAARPLPGVAPCLANLQEVDHSWLCRHSEDRALDKRMMAVADHETFELGPLTLQGGLTLPKAQLAYKTYGRLATDKSNVIVYPTSYGAHHTDIEWLIGRQRVLDPERYFIVIPNQFGNGLSTSPSNLAEPFGLGRTPLIT